MRHHSDDADMACRVNWIAETLARDSLEKRFGGGESERSVEIREGRKSVRENVELTTLYFLTPSNGCKKVSSSFSPLHKVSVPSFFPPVSFFQKIAEASPRNASLSSSFPLASSFSSQSSNERTLRASRTDFSTTHSLSSTLPFPTTEDLVVC